MCAKNPARCQDRHLARTCAERSAANGLETSRTGNHVNVSYVNIQDSSDRFPHRVQPGSRPRRQKVEGDWPTRQAEKGFDSNKIQLFIYSFLHSVHFPFKGCLG